MGFTHEVPMAGFEVHFPDGITRSEWLDYLLVPGYTGDQAKWEKHVSYTFVDVPGEVAETVKDQFGVGTMLLVWWDMDRPSVEQITQIISVRMKASPT